MGIQTSRGIAWPRGMPAEMSRAELLAAAERLQPLIREHADAGDRNRCIEPAVVRAMAEAGLYRMGVARSCGGFEADIETQVLVIEAVARADGATGWTLMIGAEVAGISSGFMTDEAAGRVFREPLAITAGAINPLGTGVRVPGGYRVTGQWPFASGCHHSTYFWGQFVLHEDGRPVLAKNGQPVTREVLIPREQYTILDTWYTGGMRGSGSADIRVDDLFVPDEMITDTSRRSDREPGTLFRLPSQPRLQHNKVGVSLGIARHALDGFVELALRKTPRLSAVRLAEREQAQLAYAEAEATLRSARAWMFENMRELWATVDAHEPVGPEQLALFQISAAHTVDACVRAVELVYRVAGVHANVQGSPLERCLRDVHVVPQHVTVNPAQYAPGARILFGLPSQGFIPWRVQ